MEIITQNVDDLHEQAEHQSAAPARRIAEARSTADSSLVYSLKHWELNMGDTCEKGSQLRPHIVWFGESVPKLKMLPPLPGSGYFVVAGTSLAVYPAAGLVNYTRPGIPIFVIDPQKPAVYLDNVEYIQEKAGKGVEILKTKLQKLR